MVSPCLLEVTNHFEVEREVQEDHKKCEKIDK